MPLLYQLANPEPDPCPLCERPNHHPSDHHMVPKSRGGKVTQTVCADCHGAIHKTFTNKELEREYNNVDTLLSHATFAKTVAYIAKQDPGGRIRTAPTMHRRRYR